MSALYNATARVLRPTRDVVDTEERQREHDIDEQPEQRCSLRALTAVASITVLGRVSLKGWTCRLVSKLPVEAGWRVQAKLDDEEVWRDFIVQGVTRSAHLVLSLEGV